MREPIGLPDLVKMGAKVMVFVGCPDCEGRGEDCGSCEGTGTYEQDVMLLELLETSAPSAAPGYHIDADFGCCLNPVCHCHIGGERDRVRTPFPLELGPRYCCSWCSSTRMPPWAGGAG